MKRRLFLQSGSAATVAAALSACGGGGGATGVGDSSTLAAGATVDASPAATTTAAASSNAAAPAAGGMPARILGCYYTAWDAGTYKITDVPSEFNVVYLFHSKPNGTPNGGDYNNVGDGSFFFQWWDDVTAEQVQACRQRGQKVLLTVGGAAAGYAWDNRTKSENFVASFKAMHDRFGGLDGIDFNNFEGSIVREDNVEVVLAEMVWIARELKAAYGEQFAVTSPPQPNDAVQQRLMRGLKDAGVLTYAGAQYYDWSGFAESGYIRGRTDTWVSVLGEANHVVVGLSANYSNGPSLDDCVREWEAIRGAHPDIRGMFCWSAQTNLAGGNGWGRTMKGML